MTRTQPDWSDLADSQPHGMPWPALAENDPYDDPEGHAAMLEAHAERPEACIRWAAAAFVFGAFCVAVFA
jgi:hypothetical protein